MVKPVYLQDNISKAPLAQIYQDLENEGAERLRDLHRQVTIREQMRKEMEEAPKLEERAGTAGIHPDGSSQGRGGRQQAGSSDKTAAGSGDSQPLEAENDLRFRRPEDDKGKGEKLDLEG
ncbi:MAG: hypothetical protein V2A56_07200 [bacterium]